MRNRAWFLIFLSAGLLLTSAAQVQRVAGKSSPTKHHTQVSLIADVQSIQPGVPFTVGVLMKMDEGWHTYWKNGGEAGLPTEVVWSLPKGFVAGEIQWPLPHKYNESGDVLTYGYETENMLLVHITPPTDIAAGSSVVLKARVSWLECEKLCVPGNADVELKLPVMNSAPQKNATALFERYRTQVPQRLDSQNDIAITVQAAKGTVRIEIVPASGKQLVVQPGVLPDFYPGPVDSLTIGRTEVTATPAKATLTIPLTILEKVSGPFTMEGVFRYQIAGGEQKAGTVAIPLSKEFCSTLPSAEGAEPSGGLLDQKFHTIETQQAQQSLVLYILFAIIGGLLLNIMPCVLPVIGLKIFGLVRMSNDEPARVKRLGWFFSLGILASFLALALLVIVLKTAGEQVGWGFQFQEPLFVIGMSTVVFAFGLSLFGVFEISLPFMLAFVGLGSKLEQQSEKGYLASFAEGVFATVLATPCTAPFLGSAMGFAFSQPSYIILTLFASVAFGMAIPYLVLTAKPNWMKFLPKPGEWMVTAKQFMGFLMMATLVWLLKVLGSQLGMESVIWTSAFLLCVALACWLIGRFATLTATRRAYLTTWGVALVIVFAGFQMFIGDVLKARDILSNASLAKTSAPTGETDGIPWQPFSLEQLESHLKANRTVFLDFTAEWCLTCKVNEKTVLADKAVVEAFKKNNVVPMKADWTNGDATITRLLQKFGRSGVPLYVVFPAGKPHEPIVLPEVITTGIVLSAIEKASGVISAQ